MTLVVANLAFVRALGLINAIGSAATSGSADTSGPPQHWPAEAVRAIAFSRCDFSLSSWDAIARRGFSDRRRLCGACAVVLGADRCLNAYAVVHGVAQGSIGVRLGSIPYPELHVGTVRGVEEGWC